MRILFLSRWFPNPADNGAKIRIFHLLRELAREHEVALVSFIEPERAPGDPGPLASVCTLVQTVPYRSFQPTRMKALTGLFSPRPRSVVDTYNLAMVAAVREVAAQFAPDLVIASEVDMAPYGLLVPDVKRIWEEIELALLHEASRLTTSPMRRYRRRLTWWKHARYVGDMLQHYDGCTVVSAQEVQLLRRIAHASLPLTVVPNGVDLAHYDGDYAPPVADRLIYAGALTYHANLDAMQYFVSEVLPLILQTRPNVRLSITGSTKGIPNEHLPTHPAVTLTGYLPDIRPAVATSMLAVVPLRVGGGTRLKILESLALGTPVVTTGKGLEGLEIAAGDGVLVADTPEAFAAAVLQVLEDADQRQRLCQAGRDAIQQYDWTNIGDTMRDFVRQIASSEQSETLTYAA